MTPERWQQIEARYHAAFLTAACGADDDLRREVESLLSQADSSQGLLASPGFAAAARAAAALPPMGPGRTLGTYRLEALVGVGGMGEVYRARDGKLGRDVAIKVLPHAFTSDPARLARFEREARTLAALNHPNICAIYGLEESQGVRFLILELVAGETLADRLVAARQRPGGPGLPLREALGVARQIARALDFAHERGIVHRDLKPANLKISSDGTVKVLDFGLAKAAAGDGAGADLVPIPTATHDGTVEGAIIGTPAYMSPEQARGKPVDKRTDIWAFGCVLFEMLTGRATFAGDTVADTLARVLEREPDWTSLPPGTPDPIRNLLVGCLAKDPRERLRDIGDVRITIDSILSGSSGVSSGVTAAPRPKKEMARLPWAVAAALAIVTVWMALKGTTPPLPPATLRYSTITIAAGQNLDRGNGAHVVSISDDGLIAYVATPRLLYLRHRDAPEAMAIQGIQRYKGVREPAFSPANDEVVFYTFLDKSLTRMRIADGQTFRICPVERTPTGIDWWSGGILFGQGSKGILRVDPNGGPVTTAAAVEKDEEAHGPQVLPGGTHFIYTVAKGRGRDRWDNAEIRVASLTDPTPPVRLKLTGSDARYFGGHLIYARSGVVWAVPFDPDRHETTGDNFVVQAGVSRAAGAVTGAANFSVSNDGLFIYVPGPADASPENMEISLIDPEGSETDTTGRAPVKLHLPPAPYDAFRVSPDEKRLAFGDQRDKQWTIYTVPLASCLRSAKECEPQPLTRAGSSRYATWTRDSQYIAYQSDRGGGAIWRLRADGTGEPLQLTFPEAGESHIPESWSDNTLVFSITLENGDASLWTVNVAGTTPGPKQAFGRSISTDPMSAVISPNRRMVAYTKAEKGETTICVERFPATTDRDCLTPTNPTDSPKHPQWKGNDRLTYDPRIGDFESVKVFDTREGPKLGDPEPVPYHPFRLGPPGSRTPYDVTSSGKFVGLTDPGQPGYKQQFVNEIRVISDFLEVLKEKAGKGK
jgi:serine/threonine-protein kinase